MSVGNLVSSALGISGFVFGFYQWWAKRRTHLRLKIQFVYLGLRNRSGQPTLEACADLRIINKSEHTVTIERLIIRTGPMEIHVANAPHHTAKGTIPMELPITIPAHEGKAVPFPLIGIPSSFEGASLPFRFEVVTTTDHRFRSRLVRIPQPYEEHLRRERTGPPGPPPTPLESGAAQP